TTLADVKNFLDQHAKGDSKVMAKKVDGVTVLYVGKAKSSPFERLFGIASQRKQLAKTTIEDLVKNAVKTAQDDTRYEKTTRSAVEKGGKAFLEQIREVPQNKAMRAQLVTVLEGLMEKTARHNPHAQAPKASLNLATLGGFKKEIGDTANSL